jgi:predicted transcriptional regulator
MNLGLGVIRSRCDELRVKEIDEEAIRILKSLNEIGAVNPKNALTMPEIVRRTTDFSVKRSPILYGLEYNKISNEIKQMRKYELIKSIENKDKELYYLTVNGENHISKY